MRRLAMALAIVAMALAGCGSNRTAQLGFADCVRAWNAPDNAERRERVAASVVRAAGYTRAGIQLSLTLGETIPNPVGCRVILFKQDRWIAFLARRDEDHFRFRPAMLGREEGDQMGVWPHAARRGPNNAKLLEGAKLSLTEL